MIERNFPNKLWGPCLRPYNEQQKGQFDQVNEENSEEVACKLFHEDPRVENHFLHQVEIEVTA